MDDEGDIIGQGTLTSEEGWLKKCAVLVIAHRQSTLEAADTRVVLKDGKAI